MNETWRFPGNNYTKDEGLDTADMETFKKDVLSSLARELCQNSLDAKNSYSNKPVKIVFKSFEINNDEIPQRNLLENQINACKETWEKNKKIYASLQNMESHIKKQTITCLRISDFNTTGLIGVNKGGDNNPWHYLVHGSGLSDKGDTSGGSKGIGKYATFVASYINTVFYSTKTITNEEGYEGICKLCSAKQPNTDEKTIGIGYYGTDYQNKPIQGQLHLDKNFNRTESGSDIYIVGFKNENNWKRNIISKILESFITAISFGNLEVEVDGTLINKDTLKDLVYDDLLIKKELKKSIVSQYLLLTSPNRIEDTITVDGYGDVKLYLLELNEELEEYATYKVVMIRYPYMKIKDTPKMSSIPCSAMCIIGNNNLNKVLRDVENPQHTDWEFNRIEDETRRTELKSVYNELLDNIRRIIGDHLATSDNSKTDLEGAGEYLPGLDDTSSKKLEDDKKVIKDKPVTRKKTRSKTSNVNAAIKSNDGDGVSLDISGDDGEYETRIPGGENQGKGGPIKPGENENMGGTGDDGSVLFKHAELRSMQYRLICVDKSNGKYVVSFNSDYTEKEATLTLSSLDEGGNKYPVKIISALVNGKKAEIENEEVVKLELTKGSKIKVEIDTNQNELFSGEVKVYAHR
jgi:hypothetical protein